MFGYVVAAIAIIGSAIASYFDLKTTDIPDIIYIYMTTAGILANILFSLITQNIIYIETSLIVGAAFSAIGYLQYVFKMWGGADFLLLSAIGFTIPYLPKEFTPQFISELWSFPFTFFFNLLIIGSVYSILYAIFLSFKKRETFPKFISNLSRYKKGMFFSTIVYAIISTTLFFSFPANSRTILSFTFKIYLYLLFLWILYIFLHTLQKDILEKRISFSELKEGDVLAKDIKLSNKVIAAKRIEGLTKEQVELIRKENGKVIVFEGIPYIPSFLITIIMSLTIGDLMTLILYLA